jgi:glycerol-3-phosphate dehydrogenase (NAD(P)+)
LKLAVIGGGSWGTALSIALARRFEAVRLWVYERDLAARMAASRENDVYLPGLLLPDSIEVAATLDAAIDGCGIVLGVMPSQHARGLYAALAPLADPSMLFVSATKGLETGTLLRVSQVMRATLGEKFPPRVAVFSGPTFAREVALGHPAAVVISSDDAEAAARIQAVFSGPALRLYTNDDPVGVELGAALKNVIAIGAGICQGLELGGNAMAALVTRGLAEISRLAVAMGGRRETLAGLAGLGDLVLTCTGDLSRNRRVGIELAKGRQLADITGSMRMIAEGIQTTFAAVDLAGIHRVEMPIVQQMNAILKLGKPPREAIRELMDRSPKAE